MRLSVLVTCAVATMLVHALTCAQSPAPEVGAMRKWQSRNGKYAIEAALANVQNGKAVLQRADGKHIEVEIAALSNSDRKHINQWRRRQSEAIRAKLSPAYDNPSRVRVKLGVEVEAEGGSFEKMIATFPLPMDWPEQSVTIVGKELTPHITRVRERVLDDGVKQMEVSIPALAAGETARAVFVLDIDRRWTQAPPQPEEFIMPEPLPQEVRRYLKPSPLIESEHAEIKKTARQFTVSPEKPVWTQIEAMYRWVRDHINSKEGTIPLRGALAALRERQGDCEEYTSLFVALCRANGIPARSVWVPGHAYPEFYLQDRHGNGYWFPCESLGPYSFGKLQRHDVVLQKGDNFQMSQKKERQRYVSETLSGLPAGSGGGQPIIRPVKEFMDEPDR